MEYKFYKTTDSVFLNALIKIKEIKETFTNNVNAIVEQVGARDWQQYSSGSVACFNFDSAPCKEVWKKAEIGYLPKRGNKEGKKLSDQIRSFETPKNYNDVLNDYNFPRMVMGEPSNRGIPVHNSHLCGKFEKGVFFVKVPQENGAEFTPPVEMFSEVKEWEMLKAMDED